MQVISEPTTRERQRDRETERQSERERERGIICTN